ncbi:MAG: hypothetical protein KBT53_06590 [Porticoccus sp.]|nr:hypothetical protein [Porticoccus sp.]MBQ0807034.1 hypothetical protein [Porticoccus sp.]
MASQAPVIGAWYQDVTEDQIFEVVAVDENAGAVEIQYLDGDVSELDFDTWQQMLLLSAKPPEDWRAAYELSNEDRSMADDVYIPENLNDPISDLDFDSIYGLDDI